MKIEVTPIQGTANQFTVTLAGTYRLAFSGPQEDATQAANFLRKQINRSGAKKTTANQGLTTEVRVG
jgi:cyanophycinase-like exopeptidase